MGQIPFVKMHGSGNDYVYIDAFTVRVADPPALARRVSPRRTGIGADGLILIGPSTVADCRMEMYNADGSRAEMCGNGIRCVAKYAYERGYARKQRLRIETDAGVRAVALEVSNGRVARATVDMGAPILDAERIPVAGSGRWIDAPLAVAGTSYRTTCVSVGNPHCVVFADGIDALDLCTIGPAFEHHPAFPRRINAEFAEVLGEGRVRVRVWERGSGETLACGTGACAVAVAGVLTGRTERRVKVELRGGVLEAEWCGADDHVYLTGDAVEVFEGRIEA